MNQTSKLQGQVSEQEKAYNHTETETTDANTARNRVAVTRKVSTKVSDPHTSNEVERVKVHLRNLKMEQL